MHAAVSRDLAADLPHLLCGGIGLISKQKCVELAYIRFQGLGYDAIALSRNVGVSLGKWESRCLSDMVLANAESQVGQVGKIQVGAYAGQGSYQNIVQRRVVRLLCLDESQLDNLPLPLCSGIIRVHKPQTPIRHRLDSVKVMKARTGKLMGADVGSFHGLCNKRVDKAEL